MNYKWYIIHTLSGSENKVKRTINENAIKKNMLHLFREIFIPAVPVKEMRRGKQVNAEKSVLPGYLLLNMHLTDEAWHLVTAIPRVSGFLGGASKPMPVSEAEVQRIMEKVGDISNVATPSGVYEVGQSVQVIDGAFESFVGTVEEVDNRKNKLRVLLSILGRVTPIDLDFSQIKKIDSTDER